MAVDKYKSVDKSEEQDPVNDNALEQARKNSTQTTARIKKDGKHFEILVDLSEALNVKKDKGNINNAVLTEMVFHNLKSGERASESDLEKNFGSSELAVVAEKIIKDGEVVLPTEYLNEQKDKKYKQIVDFLSKNAVSPEGRPYTPDRLMKALEEANINIKNKPIDSQMQEIIDSLSKILPLKIEMKRVKITIPAQHTGRAYGVVNEYKEKEEWMSNGDLVVVVKMPTAMIFDFYDNLNSVTHGSALTEELGE